MDISKFDLNLLLVFEAVYREQKVSSAAKRLGLSQPAASSALARLRQIVGDPLFVRCSHGVKPTRRAQQLAEPIEAALALVRGSLRQTTEFNPATSELTFNLLMTEIGQVIYLKKLLAHVRTTAPGIRFRVLHLLRNSYAEKLVSGGIDLAVGALPEVGDSIRSRALLKEDFVCMLSANHTTIGDSITLEQYLDAEHVVESNPDLSYSEVTKYLHARGADLKVMLRLPQLLPAYLIVRDSDLIATVPSRWGEVWCEDGRTKLLPLPFEVPPLNIRLYWHERFQHDPANRWLRAVFIELFGKPGHAPPAEELRQAS